VGGGAVGPVDAVDQGGLLCAGEQGLPEGGAVEKRLSGRVALGVGDKWSKVVWSGTGRSKAGKPGDHRLR